MKLSDQDIDRIIKNNCGDPPQVELLEYHIWLNRWKLDFYTKNRLHRKDKDHEESIESYRMLVNRAVGILQGIKKSDGVQLSMKL